ncbi:MAG: YDG domain-containing protein [Planctomycetota bacterium]|nr:YDG domain-containing protein [Planctomycetota bacterium]
MGFWNLLASKWNRNNRPKTIGGRHSKPRRNVLALEFLEDRTTPTNFVNFVDPSPSAGNGFGTVILPLISGGNVVVTAPFDDSAFTDAGAVYLYNGSTGALISTIKGSSANNNIGSGGVTALTNGNFVISSPNWDSATANNVGAATWGSASTGVAGSVSSTNSLVGTTVTDQVGSAGVVALSNGHYAVASPLWNGADVDTGAATWGNGTGGTVGAVSSTNSLVGTTPSDQVASGGLKALTGNGNFVVVSPGWDLDLETANAGAVTWVAGATEGTVGRSGAVTTSNSMAGGGGSFFVGSGGVTVLTNGNYVTSSPEWGSGNGAATWGNGTAATTGIVAGTNSIGGSITDRVSSGGVVALNNGSFVIKSPGWSGTFGAATWGSGTAALLGNISTTNSLVGSTAGDAVGTSVVALTGATGNYVVVTSLWDNGTTANVGAVTWGSRTTGVVGTVGTGNSIVGSTANDQVGSGGVIALSNGHYVISSPNWDSATADVGAATWASGTALTSATVASGNSTIGSTATDNVSSGGIAALSNGNYVIASPNWDNGGTANVGAATWASGTAVTSATVATSNSYVGSTASDQVASGGVIALTGNGNYVIVSPNWDNSATANVGAVTWVNGAATANGTVATSNSVYGDTATDQVGSAGVTALASGNYLVSSPLWDNGSTVNAGATTSLRGGVATAGAVSANYSITGSTASGGLLTPVVDTTNNNFYTRFTAGATGQAGGLILAGSITPTPPLITSAATTTITYGDSWTFTVIATGDPDNNDPAPLVFSATGIPAGVTLNTSSGVLTGTPRAGTHNLVITASNKVASSSIQNFSLIVNQRVLTVSGTTAANKVYNGNTTAVLVTGSSALVNTVGGDSIGLDVSAATGTFPAKTIGTGLLVTIVGMTLTGTDSANYLLTQPTTTADITAKGLTVSGTTAANKVYDGNTTATMNQTSSVLVGIVSGDTVTLGGTATGTFPAKTIGTSLLVTIAGFTKAGADAGNYTLTQPTTTADITAKGLTVSGTTAANKVYDGNTTATMNQTSSALVGIVSGDTVTLGGTATGTFPAKTGNHSRVHHRGYGFG